MELPPIREPKAVVSVTTEPPALPIEPAERHTPTNQHNYDEDIMFGWLKRLGWTKIRSAVLMLGGVATTLGLLPQGAAEVVVNNAEVVVGALATIWGLFAYDRSKKEAEG